jgi:glucose/arabinose dehydrogenase
LPIRAAIAAAAALLAAAALAPGAGAVGTPVAADGVPVTVVATGETTTTAFAFVGSTMFAGRGPTYPNGSGGGIDVIAGGTGRPVPDSPHYVYGLATHDGTLYVSTGPAILAYSGWNGTSFAAVRTVYAGGPQFNGFAGLAFGPDGRLYAGLLLKEPQYDHTKDPDWLSQGVVSMTTDGNDLRFLARGLRQPFQLHFPAGSRYPYVSDLGQDLGAIPPDEIVLAKPGQNYGFPRCTWLVLADCAGYTHPLILLPQHASPMGISSLGQTLYVALYTGLPKAGSEVVTIPTAGGRPTPFITGFGDPVISLAIHDRVLYVGGQSGTIWSVQL